MPDRSLPFRIHAPRFRPAFALLAVTALSLWVWRSQLFIVSRPGAAPRPLTVVAAAARPHVALDVVLPAIPVGMRRLRDGHGVLLLHYWAPWERNGAAQAAALDSLGRLLAPAGVQVAIVCFDPFPSVARYVGRHRLGLDVLLDGGHRLRAVLPCPSVPYTYVIDGHGRLATAQPGEVDWFAPETRAALARLLREADVPHAAAGGRDSGGTFDEREG